MNGLTDVKAVKTTSGDFSVRDALVSSSQIDCLDVSISGAEVSATLRLLMAVGALAFRNEAANGATIHVKDLSAASVDAAIEEIGSAANLYDPEMPFLQRPALPPKGPKDSSRLIGPGNQPVKKLLPFMPPDQAESFWSLSSFRSDSLSVEESVRALAMFHNFSMAGNNIYDGDKCAMGAPGIRFPGTENTATEVVLLGANLFETIALNLPLDWVEGGGLPAWADRTAERSIGPDNEPTPLWRATWSSNAAVGYWDNGELTGVRIGGIPESWYHWSQGKTKESRKAWWDERNTSDPLYLYVPDKNGTLHAQRLDLQRDAIDLAIEWNAVAKYKFLQRTPRVRAREEDDRLLFLRHRVEGSASSPVIRASEVLVGSAEIWAPSEDAAYEVQSYSQLMRQLHRCVTNPFRRARSGEKSPAVIPALEARKGDASAEFWRNASATFRPFVLKIESGEYLDDDDLDMLRRSALDAFDNTVTPHEHSYRSQIANARADVARWLAYWVNKYKNGTIDE